MKIFLSVGHSILRGGGCTSASGYVNEYRYNKALAPYVKRELEKQGHSVDIIVCPEGQFSNWKQERNYKLPIANSGKYNLVAELHLNASNGVGNGSECLYYPGDNRGQIIADRFGLAMKKQGFKNRGSKSRGDLYILAATKPLAVLFESFFCDNKQDTDLAKKIGFEGVGKVIAYAITGISDYNKSNGWKEENGKWYYYKNGNKHVGWLEYNKNWFYFNSDGTMHIGWLEYNKHWFYFNNKGYMLKGKQQIDGKEYIFDSRGYMQ